MVASDTRDPWLESSHQQNFIYQIFYQLYNGKDDNKEKEAENGSSLKKVVGVHSLTLNEPSWPNSIKIRSEVTTLL